LNNKNKKIKTKPNMEEYIYIYKKLNYKKIQTSKRKAYTNRPEVKLDIMALFIIIFKGAINAIRPFF
jgi:hypothetical protein